MRQANLHSGTAPHTESMIAYDGMKFTIKDNDNDNLREGKNCAQLNRGGWWFDRCLHETYLNGLYKFNDKTRIYWDHQSGFQPVFVEMKFRRKF